jgi:hypothetical protein
MGRIMTETEERIEQLERRAAEVGGRLCTANLQRDIRRGLVGVGEDAPFDHRVDLSLGSPSLA